MWCSVHFRNLADLRGAAFAFVMDLVWGRFGGERMGGVLTRVEEEEDDEGGRGGGSEATFRCTALKYLNSARRSSM